MRVDYEKSKKKFKEIHERIVKKWMSINEKTAEKLKYKDVALKYFSAHSINTVVNMDVYFLNIIEQVAMNPGESLTLKEKKDLQHILDTLNKKFFMMTGYLDKKYEEYNEKVNENGKYQFEVIGGENPFFITKEKLMSEFDMKCTKNDSIVELLAKCATWINRATKQMIIFKENIMIDPRDEKIYKDILRKLQLQDPNSDGVELKKFIEYYTREKFKGKGELDDTQKLELKSMRSEIDNIRKTIIESYSRGKSNNINIPMNRVEEYIVLDHCISRMYLMKSTFVEEILREISINLEKYKGEVYIAKVNDGNISYEKKDSDATVRCFDTIIQIALKGYNTPICMHCDSEQFKQLEKKYNIEIPNKKIAHLSEVGSIPYRVEEYMKELLDKLLKVKYFPEASNMQGNITFHNDWDITAIRPIIK